MNKITIWKREDSNTTPRGLGSPPSYHLDKPYTSESEMIWAEPILCTLPDGYSIAESNGGTTELYDENNQREQIIDDHGHPAIAIGVGRNKNGKESAICRRLDK